jgi:hypothetical protein
MKPAMLLAFACGLVLTLPSVAQNSETRKAVFGYQDPKTGMFHPLDRTPLSAEAAAGITPTTGTVVFTVTIQVSSAIPTTAPITCGLNGGVNDTSTGFWTFSFSLAAKRVSSTSATCTLTMPYSVDLGSPSTDTLSLDLSVGVSFGVGTTGFYEEFNTMPALTMKVPPNGTQTKKTITTTI